MAGPLISGLLFSAIVILLSIIKPDMCRVFLGFFFVVMGFFVNLSCFLTQPFFVYEYGMGAWLPLYREITESVIGLNPRLFAIMLMVSETIMGLFLLYKGWFVKVGITAISLFGLILIPFNYSQIAWALSLIGAVFLLRKNYEMTFIEIIQKKSV